jgi:DNA ligase-1
MEIIKKLIQDLRNTTSSKEKIAIIHAAMEKSSLVDRFLNLTYDPYLTFGVKKVPEVVEGDSEIDISELFVLAMNLAKRKLTGNAALDAIRTFKTGKKDNWLVDLLLQKDIKAGVSVKTINKAAGFSLISEFSIPLCQRIDRWEEIPNSYGIVQAKLDGVRNLSFVNTATKQVYHMSRAGKLVPQFDGLWDDELIDLANKLPYKNDILVFDGEVLGGTWNDTIKAKAFVNENRSAKENLKFYIFGYFTQSEMKGENSSNNQTIGEITNCLMHNITGYKKLVFPKTYFYKTAEDAYSFYQSCISDGYEGVVIKKSDSLVNFKKSKDWLKFKPVIDLDGEIIEVVEGTGKYKGMLGAFIVRGKTENDVEFLANVGSGFTDEQRAEYWKNAESLIGKMIEIEAQEVTTPESGVSSVRFPIFKFFRPDKD